MLDVTEPATVAQFQGWARDGDRRHPRPRRRRRCWSAAPPSTPARSSTASSSPAPTSRCVASWRPSSSGSAARPSTQRLAGVDPAAAAQIEPDNGRRVVRALEVIALTGRPYSASLPRLEYADPLTVQIGVDIDRPTLDERISRRVDEMFASGFVEEVEALLAAGARGGPHRPAGDRLPRGHRLPRRRPHPGRGDRADQGRRPGASRGARTAGSARTRASCGWPTTTPTASTSPRGRSRR